MFRWEIEFTVKLYCSHVIILPQFPTYNMELRVSPVPQLYCEDENRFYPDRACWNKTEPFKKLLLLLFYTAYYPQPSLVLMKSALLLHLPVKFHLKCLSNSKRNSNFSPFHLVLM